MFQNVNLDKLNLHGFNDRLNALATNRNKSETHGKSQHPKFRMTQRLVKPANTKKIKSQALSPDEIRINHVGIMDNKNLRKSMTFRTQSNQNKNHFIFNPDFKFHVNGQNAGRLAAMSNHSPEKIKIRTSGLLIDTIPTSSDKNVEKSESKTKYAIHSTRKYSLISDKQNQKQKADKNVKKQEKNKEQNGKSSKLNQDEFTQFQTEEIKKYQVYYKGKRRIHNKSNFSDLEGFPIVQKGDSVAYRYEIIEELGKGAFGYVFKAKDHKKNQLIALKIIRSIPKLNKQAKIEIDILQKCIANDPENKNNIVRMKGSFVFRSHTCISYELLSLNLYEYLKFNKFKSTPDHILVKFTIQILYSLAFLHGNKIVHCDIKPENIMLKELHKTGLRLIDLGSSCYEDQQFYTYIQSRYYRAPQVILGIRYTTSIDIWSLGCVLAEMHTGYPLFPGESEQQQLMMYIQLLGLPPNSMLEAGTRRKRFFNDNFQCRIIQSSDKYRTPKGLTLEKALDNCKDKLFVDFIKNCIQWEPSKRIKPKEALLHQWIISGIPPNIRPRHVVEVTGQPLNF